MAGDIAFTQNSDPTQPWNAITIDSELFKYQGETKRAHADLIHAAGDVGVIGATNARYACLLLLRGQNIRTAITSSARLDREALRIRTNTSAGEPLAASRLVALIR